MYKEQDVGWRKDGVALIFEQMNETILRKLTYRIGSGAEHEKSVVLHVLL